jgi:hypothetical protein
LSTRYGFEKSETADIEDAPPVWSIVTPRHAQQSSQRKPSMHQRFAVLDLA